MQVHSYHYHNMPIYNWVLSKQMQANSSLCLFQYHHRSSEAMKGDIHHYTLAMIIK